MQGWLKSGWIMVSIVLISACHNIEHRSESITKSPLPKLATQYQTVEPKLIWSTVKSAGVGKTDAKLQMAFAESLLVTADYKGNIIGLDPDTGIVKFHYGTKAPITAGPIIAGNRILVGTEDGYLLAYQLGNNHLLWQAKVANTVLAKPVTHNHLVFIHALDDSVSALNIQTGQLIWHYTTNTPALILRQSSSPVFVNQHLVVGFSNGLLKAFDSLEGTLEWERELAVSRGRSDLQQMVDISADPVVKDNLVYVVGYQGKLAAVKADTGTPLWERALSSYSGLAVSQEKVFVPDVNGTLWAVDRKTGEVLWKHSYLAGRKLSAPILTQKYLVVGDEDGYLHWLLQSNGAFVGRTLVDSKGIEAISVVKNQLYVLGKSGKVAAFAVFMKTHASL